MNERKKAIEVKDWKEIHATGTYSGDDATIILGENAYKSLNRELYDPSFEGIEAVLDAKDGVFKRFFNVLGHQNLKVALRSLIDAIHLHHQFSPGSHDAFLKEAQALLEELFVEINPFHYGNIKEAVEQEDNLHARFFDFVMQFRYICSLNFAWILYWMLLAKLGGTGWSDLFARSDGGSVVPFLDLEKRRACLQNRSEKIILFPYGSIFLVQAKGGSEENVPLTVGRISAGEADAYMLAPPMIQHLLDGDYYPFSYNEIGLCAGAEDAFFESNAYFDFFYHTIVPDYIGAGSAVLYGFEDIRNREYVLKHLFQYVDHVAISCSEDASPEAILSALRDIETHCGRDASKKPIAFVFFKHESVLGA